MTTCADTSAANESVWLSPNGQEPCSGRAMPGRGPRLTADRERKHAPPGVQGFLSNVLVRDPRTLPLRGSMAGYGRERSPSRSAGRPMNGSFSPSVRSAGTCPLTTGSPTPRRSGAGVPSSGGAAGKNFAEPVGNVSAASTGRINDLAVGKLVSGEIVPSHPENFLRARPVSKVFSSKVLPEAARSLTALPAATRSDTMVRPRPGHCRPFIVKRAAENVGHVTQSFSAVIPGRWSPLLKNFWLGLPVSKVFPSKVLLPPLQALQAADHGGNA